MLKKQKNTHFGAVCANALVNITFFCKKQGSEILHTKFLVNQILQKRLGYKKTDLSAGL